jgi:hypothetical protein
MVVSAVVYAIIGVAFVLAAGLLLPLYGGMSMEPITEQLLGAALIGFAVLNALARNAAGGEAGRAIVAANLVYNLIGFVALLLFQLSSTVNALGWTSVAIAGLFTLGFAYALVRRQPALASAR